MAPHLVVPLDGSQLSESALPVASALAHRLSADVTLLSSGWGSTTEEIGAYLHDRGQALDVPWSATVVPDTFPATAIAAHASDDGSVVVMATHGRSGLGKALLGSVAEDVLRSVHRPVVLLGPAAGAAELGRGPLLLAIDGGATAETAIEPATAMAVALGLKVRVVGVSLGDGTPVGGSREVEVSRALEHVAARLQAMGCPVELETLHHDDAAEALVRHATDLHAAMVAIATHGRTGLARTALGSTAMRVVRAAPCPVLVHRPVSAA